MYRRVKGGRTCRAELKSPLPWRSKLYYQWRWRKRIEEKWERALLCVYLLFFFSLSLPSDLHSYVPGVNSIHSIAQPGVERQQTGKRRRLWWENEEELHLLLLLSCLLGLLVSTQPKSIPSTIREKVPLLPTLYEEENNVLCPPLFFSSLSSSSDRCWVLVVYRHLF